MASRYFLNLEIAAVASVVRQLDAVAIDRRRDVDSLRGVDRVEYIVDRGAARKSIVAVSPARSVIFRLPSDTPLPPLSWLRSMPVLMNPPKPNDKLPLLPRSATLSNALLTRRRPTPFAACESCRCRPLAGRFFVCRRQHIRVARGDRLVVERLRPPSAG